MSKLPHTIERDGHIIARFEVESDRDYALDALREAYPDCEFEGGLDTGDDE